MVNGTNFNNIKYSKQDLEVLAKYATGVPVVEEKEKLRATDLLSYPAMISAYNGYNWLKSNKGQYKDAFIKLQNEAKAGNKILKSGGMGAAVRYDRAKTLTSLIPDAEYLKTLKPETQELYKKAQKYADIAKNNPVVSKRAIKVANGRLAQANAAAYIEKTANPKGLAKVKNALGITKLNRGINNLAAKSSAFNTCLEAYRNECGTLMLVLEGGIETAVNVVPTFKKLGVKKGFKQLGKSSAKTVASVGGWVAGSAIGTKIGAVVAAVLPGNKKAGAVIGAAAGTILSYVGGTIGQHLTTKAANKVLGKSELEKAKEEEAKNIAKMAQEDSEVFDALMQQVGSRYSQEAGLTVESEIVKGSLENLAQAQAQAGISNDTPMMTQEQLAAKAQSLQPQVLTQVQPQQQAVRQQEVVPQDVQIAMNKVDAVMADVSKYVK